MAGDDAVLVEDFLEAIASQLDRAQDGLAFKAVNRPLTYAIKDFNLQLQAYVEVDGDGNVRIRSSGPNETGASTMTIAFTTITRPMIQENTISLAATKAPTLDEAGFDPAERQRLERLGVRNTAQLRRLGSTTGASVVSRLTQIPVDRLRAALQADSPAVTGVEPIGPAHAPAAPPPPEPPARPSRPSFGPRLGPRPRGDVPAPASPVVPGGHQDWVLPATPHLNLSPFLPGGQPSVVSPGSGGIAGPGLGGTIHDAPVIRIAPGDSHLRFVGTSLATDEGAPEVRLDGVPLAMSDSDWDRIVVAVPRHVTSGSLEVRLPDGSVQAYRLVREPSPDDAGTTANGHHGNGSGPLETVTGSADPDLEDDRWSGDEA